MALALVLTISNSIVLTLVLGEKIYFPLETYAFFALFSRAADYLILEVISRFFTVFALLAFRQPTESENIVEASQSERRIESWLVAKKSTSPKKLTFFYILIYSSSNFITMSR